MIMTLSDAGDGSEWVEADTDDLAPQTLTPELDGETEAEPFDPASENETAEDDLDEDDDTEPVQSILPAWHLEHDGAADRPADDQD